MSDYEPDGALSTFYQGSFEPPVMRSSWTADGAHIVTCNGVTDARPAAPIVQRRSWLNPSECVPIVLAGHRDTVRLAVASPVLYAAGAGASNFTWTLLCSNDRTSTLWRLGEDSRDATLQMVFTNVISDVAWFSDGSAFLLCVGKSVYLCELAGTPLGVGDPVPRAALQKQWADVGMRPVSTILPDVAVPAVPPPGFAAEAAGIVAAVQQPQSPVKVTVQAQRKAAIAAPLTPMQTGTAASSTASAEQQVSVTKEGRKRIQPVLVQRYECRG